MFIRKIPYESVRRRKIRNWALLMLRLAALALIVMAFARPFFKRPALAAGGSGGAREVIVLIDRSYSMGYGDRWARAMDAARSAIGQVGASDRGSIVFFASSAEVALRSTSDRGRLTAAIAGTKPGAGATRYGPALKLAGSLLSESGLPRREVVLISDFQKTGWQGAEGVRLPDGATLTAIPINDLATANVSVAPVTLQRTMFSGQERVTITGGVFNRSPVPVDGLAITLEIGGRALQTKSVGVEPNGAASVSFDPFTPPAGTTRGTVRITPDALPADDTFNFTLSPKQPLKLVIVDRPASGADASLYLARALALGQKPPFDVVVRTAETLTSDDVQRAAVVVLNDAPVPALTAERLAAFVARGGGLLVALGDRAAWPGNPADLLPAAPGAPVDRTKGPAARLGALEYGHAIFEPFRAPRSGDFSGARFYRYRSVTPAADARILARFDDGAPALLERRVGPGRVLLWTSTFDLEWTDLPLKPVFLPFVHRLATNLAGYSERPAWLTVGDVLDTAADTGRGSEPAASKGRVILTPAGERVMLDGEGPDALELAEHGFYEVRAAGRDAEPAVTVASNVDLSESNLGAMDPAEIAAAATGSASGAAAAGSNAIITDEEHERAQRVWWYLLFAGILLLGGETLLSNRLSQRG
jgi:hypothetical protein